MTPATSTDGAAGVAAAKWYIGIVPPRAEKSVRDRLLSLGYEAYAATRKEQHVWRRNERHTVEQVLITNIVFVHTVDKELEGLKRHRILSFMRDAAKKAERGKGNSPYAIVPNDQMQQLRYVLGQAENPVYFTADDLLLNQKVRVMRGVLAGFEGWYLQKGSVSYVVLKVEMGFSNYAYTEVPVEDIQPIL